MRRACINRCGVMVQRLCALWPPHNHAAPGGCNGGVQVSVPLLCLPAKECIQCGYLLFLFFGSDQDELAQPAHHMLLETASRNQASGLSSATMTPQCGFNISNELKEPSP